MKEKATTPSSLPLIYNTLIHAYAHTRNPCVLFKKQFCIGCSTGCFAMKQEWARLENRGSATTTEEGERDRESERWERRREMKRAGVLFIHLPLHWSSLWKTETQRRNNRKGGGALSNHFSAHDISPSSCSSCPSLTLSLCLLCDDLQSNRYVRRKTTKKNTRKRTADKKT